MTKENILLVFPTEAECGGLRESFLQKESNFFVHKDFPNINLLITGAGIPQTCLELGKLFNHSFLAVVQLGICGAFPAKYPPGTLVRVIRDYYADLGAEDHLDFLDAATLNIGIQTSYTELLNMNLPLCVQPLPQVEGITVNTVHGNENSIKNILDRYPFAAIETMEGCAFFHANEHRKNVMQIRCVSNKIERRNKNHWNIPLAVQVLNNFARQLINELKD